MYIYVISICLLHFSLYNFIMYVSIHSVCRSFLIPIICLYTIYSPCVVHTCPTIFICFSPFVLSLFVTYYFHSWFLSFNLEPITSKAVNVCTSTPILLLLYADDTTLNSTLDTFGTNQVDIEKSIIIELQNILKWLDVNKLCLNESKSKFMLFHMPQKVIPYLSFSINGLQIENVYNFNFLGLTINCHLDWKPHLNSIGIKIARVIGLLRKLKYTLPTQVLRSIYNSLILPHMHYALLAWGTQCHKIELLQKKALRVIFSKSPIAHTEPLLKIMSQPKLSDLYIINLLKLYYKLYRNRLPTYFECFLPEYGGHQHNLRNDLIRLPSIRCEFEEMNAKYQMHRTLRALASPRNSAQYPNIQINDDTLGTSYKAFSVYLKSEFVNFYRVACNLANCYVCENSN